MRTVAMLLDSTSSIHLHHSKNKLNRDRQIITMILWDRMKSKTPQQFCAFLDIERIRGHGNSNSITLRLWESYYLANPNAPIRFHFHSQDNRRLVTGSVLIVVMKHKQKILKIKCLVLETGTSMITSRLNANAENPVYNAFKMIDSLPLHSSFFPSLYSSLRYPNPPRATSVSLSQIHAPFCFLKPW